mmetsp:Transcript_12810/g.35513  ORF Transcript_12810/g.35513 Transcript_12810/m.35513 type:complete len:187 (+) Transcript_12810:46-606(+)
MSISWSSIKSISGLSSFGPRSKPRAKLSGAFVESELQEIRPKSNGVISEEGEEDGYCNEDSCFKQVSSSDKGFDLESHTERVVSPVVSLQDLNVSLSREVDGDLSDADTISAGQLTPTIPSGQVLSSLSSKPLCCWHVVQNSDTLSGICIRYGTTEETLLRYNKASRASLLGRKAIRIPLIENMER